MGYEVRNPRVVWAGPDGEPQALTVLYEPTNQPIIWHPLGDSTEVHIRFEVSVAGGAPTSIECVMLLSRDGGATWSIYTSLDWLADGRAQFRGTMLSPPIAAMGAGLVELDWTTPTIPVPAGVAVAFRCKRTGGHANNTLRVSLASSVA